jgi:phosphatidylglycerophosphate synthase
MEPANRRQLKTRGRAWPTAIARGLARVGATPNQVSVASMVFAAFAGVAFCLVGQSNSPSFLARLASRPGADITLWLIAAAATIQLRLLCNLLDGLLAIEGGLKSKTGELYNEIPDRVADVLILLGAGLAVHEYPWGEHLGVFAALLAVLTAYVRLLGGSLGLPQDFRGPMAKQHRMFVLTLGALASAVENAVIGSTWALVIALWAIVIGSALTFALRTRRIARALKAR